MMLEMTLMERFKINGNVFILPLTNDLSKNLMNWKNIILNRNNVRKEKQIFFHKNSYFLFLAIDKLLYRVELFTLWLFSNPSIRIPTLSDRNQLVFRSKEAVIFAKTLEKYEQRIAVSKLARLLVGKLTNDEQVTLFNDHQDLQRLMNNVWPIVIQLSKSALYRADYEDRRGKHKRDGIVAKNPDNDVHTSQDHINNGDLSTRFISFTTALPVAVMYWAQDYSSKQRKDRVLLEIDISDPRFLVWDIVVRDMLPQGQSQC